MGALILKGHISKAKKNFTGLTVTELLIAECPPTESYTETYS